MCLEVTSPAVKPAIPADLARIDAKGCYNKNNRKYEHTCNISVYTSNGNGDTSGITPRTFFSESGDATIVHTWSNTRTTAATRITCPSNAHRTQSLSVDDAACTRAHKSGNTSRIHVLYHLLPLNLLTSCQLPRSRPWLD